MKESHGEGPATHTGPDENLESNCFCIGFPVVMEKFLAMKARAPTASGWGSVKQDVAKGIKTKERL